VQLGAGQLLEDEDAKSDDLVGGVELTCG